jgi:hypothetical protein
MKLAARRLPDGTWTWDYEGPRCPYCPRAADDPHTHEAAILYHSDAPGRPLAVAYAADPVALRVWARRAAGLEVGQVRWAGPGYYYMEATGGTHKAEYAPRPVDYGALGEAEESAEAYALYADALRTALAPAVTL